MRNLHRKRFGKSPSDAGMASSGFVVVATIVVIAVIFIAIIPLLSGTEQSSRAQTAADAAALAGAEEIRKVALENLQGAVSGASAFSTIFTAQSGRGKAATYAGKNKAVLVEYSYHNRADRVSVKVTLNEASPNGGDTNAYATAKVGLALGNCKSTSKEEIVGWTQPPPEPSIPTSSPSETPDPSPSPTTPTPTFTPQPILSTKYGFQCPGLSVKVGYLSKDELLLGIQDSFDDALKPILIK